MTVTAFLLPVAKKRGMAVMFDLLSMDREEMEAMMVSGGFPAYRGRQLFSWLYEKQVSDFQHMSNLPIALRRWLAANGKINLPSVVTRQKGKDGETVKFLFRFKDGVAVETVLMVYEREDSRKRHTVCVSTQAGCAMGCAFCASTVGGLERNLTAGEIIAQVFLINRYLRETKLSPVTNIVYMGMGEPLANWEAVWKSIRICNEGLGIGMRRITVSTCGLIPKIKELANLGAQFTLAVSLHAPNDDLRCRLMPVARHYPVKDLMAALDEYIAKTNRRVTIEYALFKDVNDQTGPQLAALLRGRLVHVNLILANPVAESRFRPAEASRAKAFTQALTGAGIPFSVRESKGGDIDAACGQLRRQYDEDCEKTYSIEKA